MRLLKIFICLITPKVSKLSYTFVLFRNVPFRVRVRLARRRNEDEDSTHKLYTLVTHVRVDSFKGRRFIFGKLKSYQACFCHVSSMNAWVFLKLKLLPLLCKLPCRYCPLESGNILITTTSHLSKSRHLE